MDIQKLNALSQWQRVAIVLTVVWFSGWAYFFWQDYPTKSRVFSEVYALHSEQDSKSYNKRDEAQKACEIQSGGDFIKDLVSGCTKSALAEHYREIQENKQWARDVENFRLEELPKQQALVLAKLLFIGLLIPGFMYAAISWISRAPKKASDISKS